jgi:UDP:flavonoid glycosyltransferase YjiC (YdhE family)
MPTGNFFFMRILFSSTPVHGHVFPLLPLARAFQRRGDSVAMLTSAGAAQLLAPDGIEVLPAGPMPDVLVAEVLRTTGHNLMEGVTVEAEAEFFAAARVDLGIDDGLALSRSWKPDLIVSEHYDFVGPLVAADLDIPVASVAYGPAAPPETVDATTRRLAARYAARGLTPRAARWYLDTCPPALQHHDWQAPDGWIGLRPEAHQNPGQAAKAVDAPHTRPRVLVSFGTLFSAPPVISPFLLELLAQDVELRVTLGLQSRAADFDIDSDRVEFVGFTPLAELLEGVDVVLTHGGAGTVLATLAAGLPMVAVPQGADQPLQAERVGASGAGIAFPLGEAEPKAVAEAVAIILVEPTYRDVAQKIAGQIAAMTSPDDVAAQLAAALA